MLPRDCDSIGCSDMILSWSSWDLNRGGQVQTQTGIFEPDADVASGKEQLGGIEFRVDSNHGNASSIPTRTSDSRL